MGMMLAPIVLKYLKSICLFCCVGLTCLFLEDETEVLKLMGFLFFIFHSRCSAPVLYMT